jgi:uncharacterized protein YdgA (DUF945 family)
MFPKGAMQMHLHVIPATFSQHTRVVSAYLSPLGSNKHRILLSTPKFQTPFSSTLSAGTPQAFLSSLMTQH